MQASTETGAREAMFRIKRGVGQTCMDSPLRAPHLVRYNLTESLPAVMNFSGSYTQNFTLLMLCSLVLFTTTGDFLLSRTFEISQTTISCLLNESRPTATRLQPSCDTSRATIPDAWLHRTPRHFPDGTSQMRIIACFPPCADAIVKPSPTHRPRAHQALPISACP